MGPGMELGFSFLTHTLETTHLAVYDVSSSMWIFIFFLILKIEYSGQFGYIAEDCWLTWCLIIQAEYTSALISGSECSHSISHAMYFGNNIINFHTITRLEAAKAYIQPFRLLLSLNLDPYNTHTSAIASNTYPLHIHACSVTLKYNSSLWRLVRIYKLAGIEIICTGNTIIFQRLNQRLISCG